MFRPVYEPRGRAREYCERALNLYTGCDHRCVYCYAPNVLHVDRELFLKNMAVRDGVLEALEKQCEQEKLAGKKILLCFTCDPYQEIAVETGTTRKALKILNRYGVNFTVLTKAGMSAARDFDLYKPGDSFGTTLTFISQRKSREWEPNASTPFNRMKAIVEAKACDIKTWVSLEPVIDPEESLKLIGLMKDYVDLWRVGKWNHDGRAAAIDWCKFGHDAEELLIKLGCEYYIKEDLRKSMEEGKTDGMF